MNVALTIHTVRNTNLYLLLADTVTFTLPPSGVDDATLTHDIGQSKAAVQISYPEHRYHREAAQSFVLDTGNEASVTSDNKAAFVTTRREAVAVSAMNKASPFSSKSAAAVVSLDQEEVTINRRN